MDEAKAAALAYLRAMPASDRAMIVRADAMALAGHPLRVQPRGVEAALRQTRPGAAALSLDDATPLRAARRSAGGPPPGEIVYAAPAASPSRTPRPRSPPLSFGMLPVGEPPDNCGLRRFSLRRSHADPAVWEIFVSVRNYGRVRREVPLALTIRQCSDRRRPPLSRARRGNRRHLPIPDPRRRVDRSAPVDSGRPGRRQPRAAGGSRPAHRPGAGLLGPAEPAAARAERQPERRGGLRQPQRL